MFRPVMCVCRLAVAIAVAGFLSACSPDREAAPAPVGAAPAAPPAATGESTVVGKAPPATGGLPAVVILAPREAAELPAQSLTPVMDQVVLTFTPAVLFVRTGQPAEFRNSDDVLHNIRVRNDETREPAFNVALPTGGAYRHTFPTDGFYDVGCDIHPGMAAVVVSSSTPYTVLASNDGTFSIPGVRPGAYTLTVYADVRKFERNVDVVPGRTDLPVLDQ